MIRRLNRSKYGVDQSEAGKQKRTYEGVTYDSEMEMQFYRDWIQPRLESGLIVKCARQISYPLQDGFLYRGKSVSPISYRSDFSLTFADGRYVVVDVKGMADAAAKLKRKLFYKKYPDIDYQWITKSWKYGEDGWIDYDKLQAIRQENKKGGRK